jgi:hypothetical protein
MNPGLAALVAAGDWGQAMDLVSGFKDTAILEWFLTYDFGLPLPRWLFILLWGLIALVLPDSYRLSWWGAIWRSLVLLVVSVALGQGTALFVHDNAHNILPPRVVSVAGTIGWVSAVIGAAVTFIVGMWLFTHFPGASAIGEHRHEAVKGSATPHKGAAMGFFRRKPADPQMGLRIDVGELNREIAQGIRPSIPHDGRYLVTMVESNGQDLDRLLWEEAATYHEVKNLLKEFQRQYGKPERISEVVIDDVNGVWMARPKRGKPILIMTVFHPASLRYRDDDDMASLDADVEAHWGQ